MSAGGHAKIIGWISIRNISDLAGLIAGVVVSRSIQISRAFR
jgi:hypothetical protein